MNNNIFQICFARINHRCIWNHKMQKQMCNVSLHIFGYHLCHWFWCCMYYCWCLAWWWVRYSWWVGCHTKIRISPIIGALNPQVDSFCKHPKKCIRQRFHWKYIIPRSLQYKNKPRRSNRNFENRRTECRIKWSDRCWFILGCCKE